MDRELLAAQSGGKLLPELCSLLENHSNEGTPPDFDASFWKRGRENVFLQMEQSCTGSKFFKDYCPRTSHVMFSGSNFSPEKSLQKILSRKICRFFVSKISPATGVRYPHKTVIVWVYPQKQTFLKKYPQMIEKGFGATRRRLPHTK